MTDERFVAYVSRPKSAALAVLLSAVAALCFALAWLMLGDAHGREGAALAGALFFAGLGFRHGWYALFDNGKPLLVIDSDGFYCRRLSTDTIPWSAIGDVGYSMQGYAAASRPLSVEIKERRYLPQGLLSFRAAPSRIRLWLPAMTPARDALVDFLSRTGRLGPVWPTLSGSESSALPDYNRDGFAASFAWYKVIGLPLLVGAVTWMLAARIGGIFGAAIGGALFAATAITFVWLWNRMKSWPIFAMDRDTIYWPLFLDRPIPWSAVETVELLGWRRGHALSVTLTGGSSFTIQLLAVSRAAEAIQYLRLIGKLPWDSDTSDQTSSAGPGLAMDRGIRVMFNDAAGNPTKASLTPDQLSGIKSELQSAPEWGPFWEYCQHRMQGDTANKVRLFDRFSPGLTAIIAKHTSHSWVLLYDGVDALYEDLTERSQRKQ